MDGSGSRSFSPLSLTLAPLAAQAQPQSGKVYRIAFLGSTSPSGYAGQMEALRGLLRDRGYLEGQNFVIEFRCARGEYERLPDWPPSSFAA